MKDQIKKLTENMWNVPNILTLLRLALTPVYAVLYVIGQDTAAMIVFGIAALTDLFDGRIARKYHLITPFGKLVDPLADKVMICTILLCQVLKKILPLPALILVAVKELLMIIGGLYMLHRGIVVHSNLIGKTATVLFVVSIVLSFLYAPLEAALGFRIDLILLWISVAVAYAALIVYSVIAYRQLKEIR